MLIVSRKKDQAINIGQDIKVIVLEIRDSQARLGIKAPDARKILREEILDTDNDKYPL